MLISRSLARRRIAREEDTSFLAAWLPVLADIALTCAALALVFQWLLGAVAGLSLGLKLLVLLVAIYLPFQIVVIVAIFWAVRSRWTEEDSK
jgi:hypothetical protein